MIVQMSGGHIIEVSDERGPFGHLITDIGKFLGIRAPEPVRVYIETPEPGTNPLMTYVPLKEDGTPDHDRTVRRPFEKAHVQKVST